MNCKKYYKEYEIIPICGKVMLFVPSGFLLGYVMSTHRIISFLKEPRQVQVSANVKKAWTFKFKFIDIYS
jgi:hypothetical protein